MKLFTISYNYKIYLFYANFYQRNFPSERIDLEVEMPSSDGLVCFSTQPHPASAILKQ